MLLAKKDKDEQVLLAEDQAWMESSSDSNQEINVNMVFMAQIEKVLLDSEASSSSADDKISEICLWIIDSGCSKHMTGNRALLTNFVEKFLGTVRFGNNDFAVIDGYGDVVIGSMTIKKVYYVEGVVSTSMVEQAKLKLDLVGKPVEHTDYRSMIGSLMYVTSSRPDIMFATCMCARYQANPNEHHVSAVKKIFRYLKGTINLGLWYPKDSGFDLTAYSDADHAGCHLDRKSTSDSV
nr:uncharacterized mitochondrial protein AtMg00810-like [Tanacetum cinerariifolium]